MYDREISREAELATRALSAGLTVFIGRARQGGGTYRAGTGPGCIAVVPASCPAPMPEWPHWVISDEAYSRILFDAGSFPSPGLFHPYSMLAHTYSKSVLAPGWRLGFPALAPGLLEAEVVRMALLTFSFGMAPYAVMQYALPDIDGLLIDVTAIQHRRDRLVMVLRRGGGYRLARACRRAAGLLPHLDDGHRRDGGAVITGVRSRHRTSRLQARNSRNIRVIFVMAHWSPEHDVPDNPSTRRTVVFAAFVAARLGI